MSSPPESPDDMEVEEEVEEEMEEEEEEGEDEDDGEAEEEVEYVEEEVEEEVEEDVEEEVEEQDEVDEEEDLSSGEVPRTPSPSVDQCEPEQVEKGKGDAVEVEDREEEREEGSREEEVEEEGEQDDRVKEVEEVEEGTTVEKGEKLEEQEDHGDKEEGSREEITERIEAQTTSIEENGAVENSTATTDGTAKGEEVDDVKEPMNIEEDSELIDGGVKKIMSPVKDKDVEAGTKNIDIDVEKSKVPPTKKDKVSPEERGLLEGSVDMEDNTNIQSRKPSVSAGTSNAESVNNGERVVEGTVGGSGLGSQNFSVLEELGKEGVNIPKQSEDSNKHVKPNLLRSRSPPTGAALDSPSKRPSIVCDFFAKGWCIKGSTCRFLHRKDGPDSTVNNISGDIDVTAKDYASDDGLKNEKTRSLSCELQSLSAADAQAESKFLLQREMIRAYGEEGHGPRHGQAMSKLEYPHKDATVMKSSILPDHRYSSSGLSIGSTMYDPFSCDKFSREPITSRQREQYESSTSFVLGGQPSSVFSHRSNSSNQSNSSSGIGVFTGTKLDIEQRYNSITRPLPLPRSSSPNYLQPPTTMLPKKTTWEPSLPRSSSPNYLQPPTTMQPKKTTWEPSLPFRSSFGGVTSNSTSPSNRYDPLLDSIEAPKKFFENILGRHTSFSESRGSRSPAYNSGKLLDSHFQAHEDKDASGPSLGQEFLSVDPASAAYYEKNDLSILSDGKGLNSIHAPETANSKEIRLEKNKKGQEDKSTQVKESKALKLFRAALVDYVKDLLKPSWRDGHLSKDSHKMIVKKATDKVLSAILPHQVPSNTELMNQYFSSSHSKLLKLVEGYVEKYAKKS